MYNGLTTADKGALLDAKARGKNTLTIAFPDRVQVVNIDLALAQIAQMESTEKPKVVTNQDALLERHKDVELFASDIADDSYVDDLGTYFMPDGSKVYSNEEAVESAKRWLLSPYTEGETK